MSEAYWYALLNSWLLQGAFVLGMVTGAGMLAAMGWLLVFLFLWLDKRR